MKTNSKIVHLHLKSPPEHLDADSYFSSIKAIYDYFTEDVLGIKYKSLTTALRGRNFYENKRCIIRIGVLHTKRQSKSTQNNKQSI